MHSNLSYNFLCLTAFICLSETLPHRKAYNFLKTSSSGPAGILIRPNVKPVSQEAAYQSAYDAQHDAHPGPGEKAVDIQQGLAGMPAKPFFVFLLHEIRPSSQGRRRILDPPPAFYRVITNISNLFLENKRHSARRSTGAREIGRKRDSSVKKQEKQK